MSSKNNDKEDEIHANSDNKRIMSNTEAEEYRRTFLITSPQISNWAGNLNEGSDRSCFCLCLFIVLQMS